MQMNGMTWGQRLSNSEQYRAWCIRCKTPLRVVHGRLWENREELPRDFCRARLFCSSCDPAKTKPAHTGLTARQRAKLGQTTGG